MSDDEKRVTLPPPRSAGHEDAERTTPIGYDTPDFASDEAAEAWIAAVQPSLAGREPSGKTGFTKADVMDAAQTED